MSFLALAYAECKKPLILTRAGIPGIPGILRTSENLVWAYL